jgi:hypothetical protein
MQGIYKKNEKAWSKKFLLVISIVCFCLVNAAVAEKWTFTVMSDWKYYKNDLRFALEEIRDMTANTSPGPFNQSEFVIAPGDLYLNKDSGWVIWQEPQYNAPPLVPVMGNHDMERAADQEVMLDTILPLLGDSITRHDDRCNYYLDWRNIRIIVLDRYSPFWNSNEFISSVSAMISSAVNKDHVFITFHQSIFGRRRHASVPDADQQNFWNMLLSHRDKVSGVFSAHSHYYSRMRIADPAGPCAMDVNCYDPDSRADEQGGIYQIDVGGVGRGTAYPDIICHVQIDNNSVDYMIVSAPTVGDPWQIIDQWSLVGNTTKVSEQSIMRQTLEPSLTITPNPFSGKTIIRLSGIRSRIHARIYNIRGELVKDYFKKLPAQILRWDASNQPGGIYIINIDTEHGNLSKHIIVM